LKPGEHYREALLPKIPAVKRRRKRRRDLKKEAALKAATKLKSEGWSLRQIAAILNSVPYTALKKGKLWHPETVRRMLIRPEEKKI